MHKFYVLLMIFILGLLFYYRYFYNTSYSIFYFIFAISLHIRDDVCIAPAFHLAFIKVILSQKQFLIIFLKKANSSRNKSLGNFWYNRNNVTNKRL